MTDDEKKRTLRELLATPEGRARIVASMTHPGRCGGLDYDSEGRPFYRHEARPTKEALDEALEIRKKVEGYERAAEKTQHFRPK